MHEAVAIIPRINKPHPGQFVSDKQRLATLKSTPGSTSSTSCDAFGVVHIKAAEHSGCENPWQQNVTEMIQEDAW